MTSPARSNSSPTRPARPLPVTAWASAYGLDREPGADPHTIPLIGPGPGFDPAYAMRTDLTPPVIIATLTPAGQPPAVLLIDGYARPVTVRWPEAKVGSGTTSSGPGVVGR